MFRLRGLLVPALVAAALMPQLAWGSGGRLPSGARRALLQAVRGDFAGHRNEKIRIRRSSISKGLNSVDHIRLPSQQNHRVYAKGAAFVYKAEATIGQGTHAYKEKGTYLVVQRRDYRNDRTYWEARALATPLTKKQRRSKRTTKRVTRPADGKNLKPISFVATGSLALHKNAIAVTVKNATVVRADYHPGGNHTAEVLATKVNLSKKTITFFALGESLSNSAAPRATSKVVLLGEEPPQFTTGPIRAASLAPPGPGIRPPQRPYRPAWIPAELEATIKY